MKKITAYWMASGVKGASMQFDSVKDAKKAFKTKVQINKNVFVAGSGYIRLEYTN